MNQLPIILHFTLDCAWRLQSSRVNQDKLIDRFSCIKTSVGSTKLIIQVTHLGQASNWRSSSDQLWFARMPLICHLLSDPSATNKESIDHSWFQFQQIQGENPSANTRIVHSNGINFSILTFIWVNYIKKLG